ncbi:hypothetical protein ACVIYL_004407 [Bradyrhizobium sp. USDA 3315]
MMLEIFAVAVVEVCEIDRLAGREPAAGLVVNEHTTDAVHGFAPGKEGLDLGDCRRAISLQFELIDEHVEVSVSSNVSSACCVSERARLAISVSAFFNSCCRDDHSRQQLSAMIAMQASATNVAAQSVTCALPRSLLWLVKSSILLRPGLHAPVKAPLPAERVLCHRDPLFRGTEALHMPTFELKRRDHFRALTIPISFDCIRTSASLSLAASSNRVS